jgi:predicted transcriptional regulator
MARYRRRFEIMADMLKVAVRGAKKTRIMYSANLSYGLLEKYLVETVRVGFLSFEDNVYRTTEKGLRFLERYEFYSGRYSKFEKDFNSLRREMEVLDSMCSHESDYKPNSPVR